MEPHVYPVRDGRQRIGWIEVICGSMFSGKTEELIRRLRRARIARQKVAVFKPTIDTRFSAEAVVSHDATQLPSIPVASAEQIRERIGEADVIGVDEAQFFGPELVDVLEELARGGCRVLVAGLDQDYLGRPFEPMPQLMAVAEHVTKLHAVCVVCGAPANHSQRIISGGERVLIGEKEAYEPRCRRHFKPEPTLSTASLAPDDEHPEPSQTPSDTLDLF